MTDMQYAQPHLARRVMVDNQIRTFDVTSAETLAAFDSVPREMFVAEKDQAIAYSDGHLRVGEGQGERPLLLPLALARLIQALAPRAGERALDVMSGTGYPAALLAAMGLHVTFAESDGANVELARKALAQAGTSVTILPAQPGISAEAGVKIGGAGFDVILVSGASELEPRGFFPLLAEGGRLGIFRRDGGVTRAMVYLKANGVVGAKRVFDAQTSILPGFSAEPVFMF
ncbi:MAG: protein-L-isoaspartate O-methyltransferase [Proteobacteria bacterium]|nr:protein-L-isoaspartate O-methyltransferase [Pseudomonadota bacterium]